MGAFIGYGEVGVWASNRERDAFLDWFASHRCVEGDARWEYCKSPGHRWTGCGIDLEQIIPRGEGFVVTAAEQEACANEYWPTVARLLGIISDITLGEWVHLVSSRESIDWRESHDIPPIR